MSQSSETPRSRRAILAAAGGAAAALATAAMLPATAAAADPNDVVKSQDNATTATTSVTNSTTDSDALGGNAVGLGFGVLGTSALGAGVLGWSVTPPDPLWFDPQTAANTGVFGSAPAGDGVTTVGTGVWGDSEDTGVFGSGGYGVVGYGGVGVEGDANGVSGSVGVIAFAPTTAQYALKAYGKVYFQRSGRTAMSSGKSSVSKTLAGVTSSSKVFAVLATSESGRYVRAVVAASGKFTVYLNTTLTSSAVVSWFVLD
jgi:hypothetical protein